MLKLLCHMYEIKNIRRVCLYTKITELPNYWIEIDVEQIDRQ